MRTLLGVRFVLVLLLFVGLALPAGIAASHGGSAHRSADLDDAWEDAGHDSASKKLKKSKSQKKQKHAEKTRSSKKAKAGKGSKHDDDDDGAHRPKPRPHRLALRLTPPPPPIIAGDILPISRRKAIRERELARWRVYVGAKPAELVRLDSRTVGVVVPPGVAGRQRLTIQTGAWWWPTTLLRKKIELAPIQLRTDGPSQAGTEFGFHFPDSTKLEAGDRVEAWVRTPELVTTGTKNAPVSLSGSIIGRTPGSVTVLVTGDAAAQPTQSNDLSTVASVSTTSTSTSTTSTSGFRESSAALFGSFSSLRTVSLTSTINLDRSVFAGKVTLTEPVETGIDLGDVVITVPVEPVATPAISSITPSSARRGEKVVIRGEGFGAVQNRSRVVLGGQPVVTFPRVGSWSDDEIVVQLPAYAQGIFELIVFVDLEPSPPFVLEVDPPCPPVPEFSVHLGGARDDLAFAIAQMPDCGYVLAGRTDSSPAQGVDALLIRTDRFGEEIWTSTFGGSGFDEARDVIVSGNRILFAGQTDSPELGAEGPDVYVAMVGLDGKLVWERNFGTRGKDAGLAITPAMDHNHGIDQAFVVGGYTTEGLGVDGLVLYVDGAGELVASQQLGGKGDDRIDGLLQVPSTGILAVGRSNSPDLGSDGSFEPYAAMLEFDGSLRWQRAYRGSSGSERLFSAGLSEDGRFVATGQASAIGNEVLEDFAQGGQILVIELDEGGNELERFNFGGNFRDVGTAGGFLQRDRGMAFAGFTESPFPGGDGEDGLLIKTDCRLQVTDAKVIDRPGSNRERVYDAFTTFDDGFATAGEFRHTPSTTGRSDLDVLLATRGRFGKADVPEIEIFEANGQSGLQVRNGDPVTLRWRVSGATNVTIERLGEVGPDFGIDQDINGFVDQTGQIASFSLGAGGCGNLCGDVVYRLTASSACGQDVANLTVTVVPVDGNVLQDEERLLEIESILVQRFDRPAIFTPGAPSASVLTGTTCAFGFCQNTYELMPGSHLDVVTNPFAPTNACVAGSGYPYANPVPEVGINLFDAEVDDTAPPLLSYRIDGTLASWSYGKLFFVRGDTTPPGGVPVPDSSWFGHYSGWHSGDGGMTIWGIDELSDELIGVPFQPPEECEAPPEFGGITRADFCGANPAPVYPHPNAWDVHMFRDIEGGGILRNGRLSYDALVGDPCAGVASPASECETGDDPLTVPGTNDIISVFPPVDFSTGTFIPTACNPGP